MLPMRLELIISSLQDWCLTTMALEAFINIIYSINNILRTPGIEPELCEWKSHSLPLTYIRSNSGIRTFIILVVLKTLSKLSKIYNPNLYQ